ncbi:hypothetical protein EJB05_36618 [Eragrostis curvula]|uniref:NB-ARC domain-containing protein n=1 Tax=Eragrostis curvula TaxID=38414 RepID=A0A5J9UB31_9POAL|nr:hypothetical protein EJB05_36618 [Eragrostis curvula]
MADLVIGLAKTTVQGTVTMARAAMDEEDKLKKSVQRDLLIISDEFDMMQSFLHDAKDCVTDQVTKTMVRQVRNTALDVEDCIETIVHLDNKPRWWRRMMLPWCMPAAAPEKDLDAVVANVEQLKARVDAMALRKMHYKSIGDSGLKPVKQTHQQAVANAMVPYIFVAVKKKQSSQMDLVTLINKNVKDKLGRKKRAEEEEEEEEEEEDKDEDEDEEEEEERGDHDDEEKEKEKEIKEKEIEEEEEKEKEGKQLIWPQSFWLRCKAALHYGSFAVSSQQPAGWFATQQPNKPDHHELKVISVLGTGSDLEIIKKAYDDESQTCKSFKIRAWVKVMHPFNPIEFIRSLLSQFYRNLSSTEPEKAVDFLEELVTTDNKRIVNFMSQIKLKYLVVLEDVSTMVDWEAVRGYLPDNKDGSCIIVHTRQFEIARSCVGHGCQALELEKSSTDPVYVFYKEDVAGKVINADTNDKKKILPYEKWLNKNPLFGRDEDLERLSLLSDPGDVVSVWGMPGVGKSFLVQHFYRKEQDKNRRNKNYKFVWVDVPRGPFDVRDFSGRILSELNPPPEDSHLTSAIKDPFQGCREYIQKKKDVTYLIVIDGLQSTENWDLIRPIFSTKKKTESNTSSQIPNNVNSEKIRDNVAIIIITNEESVANYCCAASQYPNLVWNVKGLEVNHAIQVFNEVVVKYSNPWDCWNQKGDEMKHRNDQTRGILLQKCGGLPKVICAVAESWRMFLDTKEKDNLVSKLEENATVTKYSLEGMFSWLRSYFHSCSDSLKPCIFYLSIFPINLTIRRRRLIRRWIAEGYFRDSKESTAEENGERSYSDLINLSMIQAPRTRVDDKRMPLCQVNGFLREYIVSRFMDENLVFALEGNCKKNIQRTGRHLAIYSSWDRDRNVFESMDLSLLRSLTVFGKWETFIISDRMRLLRVLDLENASDVTNGDVEKMVKLLPRLKFLSLRGCREISHLPDSLGDLKQLQTLDIRETSVIKLPKSIIKLEKLQYIRAGTAKHHQASEATENPSAAAATTPMSRPYASLGSCSYTSKLSIHRRHESHSGVKVPRGIGKLSSLHTLGVVNIHASGEDGVLEELKNLTQLHKFGVSGINRKNSENFFQVISHLVHLESLSLKMQANQDNDAAGCMADISSPLEKLRSLKLYGLNGRLPSWIMQMCLQLPRLEKLDLQMKTLPQQELDFILTLKHLCSLRLQLAEFQEGELRFGWSLSHNSGRWIINFLEIACNSRLQAVRFGSKIEVEILKIRCSSVSSSLKFSGLASLESLKEVRLCGSWNDAFEKQLEEELKKKKKKPILELEKPSSST